VQVKILLHDYGTSRTPLPNTPQNKNIKFNTHQKREKKKQIKTSCSTHTKKETNSYANQILCSTHTKKETNSYANKNIMFNTHQKKEKKFVCK
jgi:hypothetical protein